LVARDSELRKSVRRKSTVADHRVSGLREGRMPKSDTSTREVPSSERREHPGPQKCREDRSRQIQRDTWCAIRLPAFSPLATLKHEDQPPPRRETRSAEGTQDLGPQYRPSVFSRPIKADTWRAIKLPAFSPIAVSTRKKQFHHVPIREEARAFRIWGPPQHRMSLEPSDLKGAWHQIKLSRHIAHRDSEEQGAALTYSRTPKSAMGIGTGSQPVVTEERKELRERGQRRRVSERPVTTSSCHRTRPRSWSSLGVNESKKGWLKPLFIH
jgi:hypothetical protein